MSLLSIFLFVVSYHISGAGTTEVPVVNSAVGPYTETVQAPDGKIFVGWVDHEVTTPTDVKPEIVTTTGALTGVRADKDLYALFGNPTGEYTPKELEPETFESYSSVASPSYDATEHVYASKDVVWRIFRGDIIAGKKVSLQFYNNSASYARLSCYSIFSVSYIQAKVSCSATSVGLDICTSTSSSSLGTSVYTFASNPDIIKTTQGNARISVPEAKRTPYVNFILNAASNTDRKLYLDDITLTINIPTCTGYTTSAGCQSCLQVTLR